MSSKVAGILSKVHQDRQKGDYQKALKRLEDAIDKLADDITLYKEAIEVAVEAGESLRAVQFFKSAQKRMPESREDLWAFGRDKVEAFNDPILCKQLLDMAIRKRDLDAATEVLEALKEHTAAELLTRIRTKRQVLSSARDEGFQAQMMINALAEALLCVRARAYDDAGTIFVQILDDQPSEQETLAPYLTTLQKKFPDRGAVCYAAGWCAILAKQYEKAIALLSQGGSIDPAYAKPCLRRLETLKGNPDVPHPNYEFAVAKLFIVKGDDEDAASLLRELLAGPPSNLHLVLDLLDPHIQKIRGVPVLHFVFVEAALAAGKSAPAVYQMESIYSDGEHKTALFEWLDKNANEPYMSVDARIRHGELCLKEKNFGKTVEIFKSVLVKAAHEVHNIKAILASHQENPEIKSFYATLKDATDGGVGQGGGGGGFSIEHYGGNEFSLERRKQERRRRSASEPKRQTPEKPTGRPTTQEPIAGFERHRELDLSGRGEQSDGPGATDSPDRLVDDGFEFSSGFDKDRGLDLGSDADSPTTTFRGEFDAYDMVPETDQTHAPESESNDEEDIPHFQEPYPEADLEQDKSTPIDVHDEHDSASDEPAGAQDESVDELYDRLDARAAPPSGSADEPADEIAARTDEPSRPTDEAVAGIDTPAAGLDETPVTPDKPVARSAAPADEPAASLDEPADEPAASLDEPADEPAASPDEPADEPAAPPDELSDTPAARSEESVEQSVTERREATGEPEGSTDDEIEAPPQRTVIALGVDTTADASDDGVDAEPTTSEVSDDVETTSSTDDAGTPTETAAPLEQEATAAPPAPETRHESASQTDNRGTLELIEQAAREGRMSDMRKLLSFQPATLAEESQQKRYLAEFYIHDDQPAAALEVLKTVNTAPLAKSERKEHLLKMAYCYKTLNQFDAAQRTYMLIMNEDPDFCVAEQLARVSYEKHIETSTSGSPVLEKVSSLHTTGSNEEEN